MPLVSIQASQLTAEQKVRVGDRVIEALQREGVAPSSIVVLFKREDADIFLDGCPLWEVPGGERVSYDAPVLRGGHTCGEAAHEVDYAAQVRRPKVQPDVLKTRLLTELKHQGSLTSFEAQRALGLQDDEHGSSLLRRLFSELEEEGVVAKQGQKRGTRYVWQGSPEAAATVSGASPMPILVKRDGAVVPPQSQPASEEAPVVISAEEEERIQAILRSFSDVTPEPTEED